MNVAHQRRSDRVDLELGIELSGVEASGGRFVEWCRTVVISRHGAKIVSERVLLPQQAIKIQCRRTGMETLARVVGQIGHDAEQTYYALEFSDPSANIWGIEFPPLAEADPAAGRVLLQCQGCHTLEVTHLDVFALEVLVANQCLMLPCRQCTDRRISVWKQASQHDAKIPAPRPAPPAPLDEPKRVHISLKVIVCIRDAQFGDEVALTDSVWCGGFRFKSHRCYDVGSVINAAFPYSPDAASVFAPARVVSAETLSAEGTFMYGAAYGTANTSASGV